MKKWSVVLASVRLNPNALDSSIAAATGQPQSAGSSPDRNRRNAGHEDVRQVVDDVVEARAVDARAPVADAGQAGEPAVDGVDRRRGDQPQERRPVVAAARRPGAPSSPMTAPLAVSRRAPPTPRRTRWYAAHRAGHTTTRRRRCRSGSIAR